LSKESNNNGQEFSYSVEMKDSCHISGHETENYAKLVLVLVKTGPLFQFIDEFCCLVQQSYVFCFRVSYGLLPHITHPFKVLG
jgi:hypothetical protein